MYEVVTISRGIRYIKILGPGIGIHLDNWNKNIFFSDSEGIGLHLLFWQMNFII